MRRYNFCVTGLSSTTRIFLRALAINSPYCAIKVWRILASFSMDFKHHSVARFIAPHLIEGGIDLVQREDFRLSLDMVARGKIQHVFDHPAAADHTANDAFLTGNNRARRDLQRLIDGSHNDNPAVN